MIMHLLILIVFHLFARVIKIYRIMNEIEQLKTEIDNQYKSFVENHEKSIKGNKSAGIRARKAALSIMNLMKQYRKESIKI